MPRTNDGYVLTAAESPVALLVDTYGAALHAEGVDEAAAEALLTEARAANTIFDDALGKLMAQARDQELSSLGRRRAVARTVATAIDALRGQAERLQAREREFEAARAKALAEVRPTSTADRVEAAIRGSEIRAHLSTLDDLEIMQVYLRAVAQEDAEVALAVEGAPATKPLITAETRERADAIRLARSPQRDALAALERRITIGRTVLATAQGELQDRARLLGIWPDVADLLR